MSDALRSGCPDGGIGRRTRDMLIENARSDELKAVAADVVVIGSGPLGLNTAFALSDRSFRVLVLESGGRGADPDAQDLARDEVADSRTHYPAEITVARRLGGTSNVWGGRCVPNDAIDFRARPWLDLAPWPIGREDLDEWLAPACAALGAGQAVFHAPVPGLRTKGGAFSADRLERWSDVPCARRLHAARIDRDRETVVATGVTVTGIVRDDAGRLSGLRVWTRAEGTWELPARAAILAAGGNASTRLLLNVQAETPALFGGSGGPLGRHYMAHLNGQIADIVFEDAALHAAMDFHVDCNGSYVRRRLAPTDAAQEEAGIANICFWPVVPEIRDARHRSGPLSSVFLALSTPGIGPRLIAEPIRIKHLGPPPYRRAAHLRNLIADLPRVIGFVPRFLWHRRFARHRLPGFFLQNRARRYGLEFHSEHLPHPDSRITLTDQRDATGLRRARLDLRFSEADVRSVLTAHDALERWLGREGLARLDYRMPLDRRADGVLAGARHGNHQQGTIRMGHDRCDGVVDGWGSVFDVPGLHVVSTAILPTTSQANPTLTALQIGLRLAARLAREREAAGRPALVDA
jgi:choline dehydrogenase-like flavoprotein